MKLEVRDLSISSVPAPVEGAILAMGGDPSGPSVTKTVPPDDDTCCTKTVPPDPDPCCTKTVPPDDDPCCTKTVPGDGDDSEPAVTKTVDSCSDVDARSASAGNVLAAHQNELNRLLSQPSA